MYTVYSLQGLHIVCAAGNGDEDACIMSPASSNRYRDIFFMIPHSILHTSAHMQYCCRCLRYWWQEGQLQQLWLLCRYHCSSEWQKFDGHAFIHVHQLSCDVIKNHSMHHWISHLMCAGGEHLVHSPKQQSRSILRYISSGMHLTIIAHEQLIVIHISRHFYVVSSCCKPSISYSHI